MERPATSVVTTARTTGSSSVIGRSDADDVIRQQLITELLMQQGRYPSCTSADDILHYVIPSKYTCIDQKILY